MATRLAGAATFQRTPAPAEGPAPVVAVAYSGGRDSLALLHATCRSARMLGVQVVAIHIHHGLLAEADGWLRQARERCRRWQARGWPLTLRWARLQGAPGAGESVEAWARRGRHAALQRLALEAGATLLLLAHHRRDQAETVLLQALRGGGAAGLAAMPAAVLRDGLVWARPWLDWPREAIEAYVQRHRLNPVEDPSNADHRLARNRLRSQLWPALEAAFPQAEPALALAARRAHEDQLALAELAALDLSTCCPNGGALDVPAWRALSAARQANALRAWWRVQCGRGAPEALVQRLLAELPGAAGPAMKGRAAASGASAGCWPAGEGMPQAELYRGKLRCRAAPPDQSAGPPADELTMDLSRPGLWPVPGWGGAFEVVDAAPGLSLEALCQACLRPRRGGEQFQHAPRSTPRSLKKQYQAAGIPAVQRAGPLVWWGDRLLHVPGLGDDARAWAAPGTPQRRLRWCPNSG